MSLQGKQVMLTQNIPMMGREGIRRGLAGRVEWDDGGVDVIVEFEQEVPNGNMLPNHKQAWVPRHFLEITL